MKTYLTLIVALLVSGASMASSNLNLEAKCQTKVGDGERIFTEDMGSINLSSEKINSHYFVTTLDIRNGILLSLNRTGSVTQQDKNIGEAYTLTLIQVKNDTENAMFSSLKQNQVSGRTVSTIHIQKMNDGSIVSHAMNSKKNLEVFQSVLPDISLSYEVKSGMTFKNKINLNCKLNLL